MESLSTWIMHRRWTGLQTTTQKVLNFSPRDYSCISQRRRFQRQNRLHTFFSRWGKKDSGASIPGPCLKPNRHQQQSWTGLGLEPAENFRTARLKLMVYRQEPLESLDDFVNRCKLQVLKCAFTPAETNERLLELIIASVRDSDF